MRENIGKMIFAIDAGDWEYGFAIALSEKAATVCFTPGAEPTAIAALVECISKTTWSVTHLLLPMNYYCKLVMPGRSR